ncbi:phage terminase, small subunit, P27 family [Desulfitobacterium hafniense DCB-2]|uniref:Phage terminase, small subunit, P27 family n=1 Tax=Desulfitobacterium hafniense (strain DSM 10664 / DCB-2) TaxID=272564 RepID=B8FNY2_DESHD|nr:phage terminase small subunit P27 family [Desulfitobacterium hafniense]ACL19507.1 phage terminase, small subunit, P27 family [Desulfitobacterium hafniense DCB-2]
MSGRKRKSVDLLIAEGKTHLTKDDIEKRREAESQLKPKDDKIKCPSWLKDKVAKSEFRKISHELQELKLLTNLDVNTLASYCVAYAQYLKATSELADQDLVITQTNKAGFTNMVENPLIRIQLKYSNEMKKHAAEMGLTINSRLKLVIPKKEAKRDPIEEDFGDI